MRRSGSRGILLLALIPLLTSVSLRTWTEAANAGAHGNGATAIRPSGVLIEPGQGVHPLIRAIDSAQNSVFVESYILTDSRVVHALERAAAQGVVVYVLLERHPLGMGLQPERMAEQLSAAGVAVHWTSPGFYLTHAKFLVLDDRLAVVSTANLSRSAFTRNREVIVFDRERRDVHDISNLFRCDWDRIGDTVHDSHLVVSPGDSRTRLSALIRSAHRSLDLYAEEVADPGAEKLMIARARAGVRIRLIVPRGIDPPDIKRLTAGKVAVRELSRPYIHAKVIVVDGRLAFVGSENLSATSLDHNRELGVFIAGTSVRRILNVFSRDWQRGSLPQQ